MMKRILFSFIVISVLLALPVGSLANFNGETEIYQGKVKGSNGNEFEDCYIFHSDGTLEIVADSLVGVWDNRNLGRSHFRYQGVLDSGVMLGVSGVKSFFGLMKKEDETYDSIDIEEEDTETDDKTD